MATRSRLFAILLGAAAVFPGSALAADIIYDRPVMTANEWVVTVKGSVGVEPSWPGSKDYGIFAYPGLSYRRAGTPERFTAPDDGFDIGLYETPWLRIGPVARITRGRDFHDDFRLFGLRNIDWSLEPGLFVDIWPTQMLRARVEVRHGFGGHDGFVGNLGLDVVVPSGAWTFAIGPRMAWGDDNFTGTFFGVTPLEATLNPFVVPFKPNGGITSFGAASSLSYKWSQTWTTTIFGSYNYLTSDAGSNPIVRAFGSRDQFTVGASLAYSFPMKPLW